MQSVGESGAPVTVQSFAYTLDAEGKRTQLVENTGTVRQYGYDGIDRLTSETVTGSLAYAKTFTYDPVGNRESQVTTGSGAATTPYTYDTRDRMLTSDGSTYTYDANGNALTKSGEAYYTVNEENRLSQVQLTNGATIQHTYDADGNRVKTVEPSPPAAATACSGNSASFVRKDTTTQGNWIGTYGVDGDYINALTAQPPSYGTVTFTGTSNFTWASSTTDVQALEDQPPGTSRIASTWYTGGTETFSVVTTDGNEHTIALYLLDWDGGRAETVTAETPTGTVLSSAEAFSNFTGGQYAVYTICGSVNFVVTLTAGANAVVSGIFFGGAPGAATTTSSLVDTGGGLSQVVGETNASNALTALYVRAGDELLSVIRPNGTGWTQHFIHKDGLGSVRTITDNEGNIVDTRGYEAFGTKDSEAGSEPLAYGFAGEPLDTTTHLAYHRARWMDSRIGRFTGMDPLGSRSGQHLYTYAKNQPVGLTDPSGLFTPDFGRAVEGVVDQIYLNEHSEDRDWILFGQPITYGNTPGQTGGLPFVKPDIVNLAGTSLHPSPERNYGLWVEIKPFTVYGISSGISQAILYKTVLSVAPGLYGSSTIEPEAWAPMDPYITVNGDLLYTFNIQGILFYTDRLSLATQLATVTTIAALQTLESSSQFVAELEQSPVTIESLTEAASAGEGCIADVDVASSVATTSLGGSF